MLSLAANEECLLQRYQVNKRLTVRVKKRI